MNHMVQDCNLERQHTVICAHLNTQNANYLVPKSMKNLQFSTILITTESLHFLKCFLALQQVHYLYPH